MNVSAPSPSPGLEQTWVICEDPPDNSNSTTQYLEIPTLSISSSYLSLLEDINVTSGHKVQKMRILDGPDNGRVVYVKFCDPTYPPLLAQCEAAFSASFRIARGPGAAKVLPVVDPSGEVIGSASFEFAGFKSLMEQSPTASEMIELGIAIELVSRYMRMEDDLHPGNIGTTGNYGLVGIDFDMSFYPISSVLKGARLINNGIISPHAADAFPITLRDIKNFPEIVDAQPCYWPTRRPKNGNLTKVFPNSEEFRKLSKDPKFMELTYFAFLKELLIAPETHIRVMKPFFSKSADSEEILEKTGTLLKKRWEEAEKTLISTPKFREYLEKNKTVLQGCLDNFRSYNESIAENGITINLDDVQKRFDSLTLKCMTEDLKLFAENDEFKKLSEDDSFTESTYFNFLKELLVDPATHLRMLKPFFYNVPGANETLQQYNAQLEKRREEFEDAFVSNTACRKYLVKNKTILEECLKNFNASVAANEATIDHINIQKRFDKLIRKSMEKDLILTGFDLGFELKNRKGEWAEFKKFYYQLIDLCVDFQKTERSLPEAFNMLEIEKLRLSSLMGNAAKRWDERCDNISTVLNNYRGHVTENKEVLAQSVVLRYSQGGDQLPTRTEELNLEFTLAKAIYGTLSNPENTKKIIKIANKCLEEYTPSGHGTQYGSINPFSWSRARVPDLKDLIKDLGMPTKKHYVPILIGNFISKGKWNSSYLTGASANVLLISKLSEGILKGFKSTLTLEQLRKHDLVEVCYAHQSGCWTLESSAKNIADHLQKLITGKASTSPNGRLSQITI